MSPTTFTLSDAELEKLLNCYDAVEKNIAAARAVLNFAYAKPTPTAPSGEASTTSTGAWRDEPATERQLAFLQKNKITPKPGLSKGEASTLIDALIKKHQEDKR